MMAFERYCRRKRRERKQQGRDPERKFQGMENALSFLDGNSRVVVIHGPEGCGKTELVRKFVSFNRTKHCIWIDSSSEASIIRSLEIFASKTLFLDHEDSQKVLKHVSTLLKEVRDHLGEDVLLVFDGMENFEDLRCLVTDKTSMPIFELELLFKKILITTRLEEFPYYGAVLSLQGFTLAEAIDFIRSEIPYANDGDAIELSRSCQFNPKNILRKIEEIKHNLRRRDSV